MLNKAFSGKQPVMDRSQGRLINSTELTARLVHAVVNQWLVYDCNAVGTCQTVDDKKDVISVRGAMEGQPQFLNEGLAE